MACCSRAVQRSLSSRPGCKVAIREEAMPAAKSCLAMKAKAAYAHDDLSLFLMSYLRV
jgi:hypothetical protein